ncbi:MAG TPA: GTPase Era [Actinomycetota bacterium]|nr:GTPase Era [Actinomycetota bacterium]
MSETPFRSGMVAVVGRPNVGKSTLVNALMGQKVAIVSDKPQTTRRELHAVWTSDDVQVVFTDTPGFHKAKTLMGARMNDVVGDAVHGVDLVLHVVDAEGGVGTGDAFVYAQRVRPTGAPAVCVVNKVDALRAHREVPQLAAAAAIGDYDEIVPVSAKLGKGIRLLRGLIIEGMPEGPALYPDEMVTDQPLDVRLADIVREKALAVTRQEVPHSIAVVVNEFDLGDGLARVFASLFVERESQKGIVIGRGGETLKTIGSRAREEMELVLGCKVFLDLHVKVLKEWQRDPRALERLGF